MISPVSYSIRENYIPIENTNNKEKDFKKQDNIIHPNLYQQLIGKDRQRSVGYNVLILAAFNVNIGKQ